MNFSKLVSFFYPLETHIPPIDLSPEALKKWELPDGHEKQLIEEHFMDQRVKKIFTQPLSFDLKTCRKNCSYLKSKGWELLSAKPINCGKQEPFYTILSRSELSRWVLKHAARRKKVDEEGRAILLTNGAFYDFNYRSSILRIPMALKIQKACKENPEEFSGINAPKKYLCKISSDTNVPIQDRYIVVAERIECLGIKETFDDLSKMMPEEQKALARKLIRIIKIVGIEDFSLANVRLGKEGDVDQIGIRKIYILDTEPSNLMIPDRGWIKNFFTLQSSVEKCARVGILFLSFSFPKIEHQPTHFYNELIQESKNLELPRYSLKKIKTHLIAILILGGLYFSYRSQKLRKSFFVITLLPIELRAIQYFGLLFCAYMKNSSKENKSLWWTYYAVWFAGEQGILFNNQRVAPMYSIFLSEGGLQFLNK